MSRTKKSRTAGNSEPKFNGQRKETSSQAQEARARKHKAKQKGHKSGARNTIESKQTQKQNAKQINNEKRIGSKKAISLVVGEKPQEVKQPKPVLVPKAKIIKTPTVDVNPKLSAEKELAILENDQRLNDLLEQLDNNESLSHSDQSWVNKQMDRHQKLMKQLGWLDDDGEEDLLQQFEDAGSALDEFKK